MDNKNSSLDSKRESSIDVMHSDLEFQAHWQIGDWDWLIDSYSPESKGPRDSLTNAQLAVAHFQNGSSEIASHLYKQISLDPSNSSSILSALMAGYACSLAKCHLSLGNVDGALKVVSESIDLDGLSLTNKSVALFKLASQIDQMGLSKTDYLGRAIDVTFKADAIDYRKIFLNNIGSSARNKKLLELLFGVLDQYSRDNHGDTRTAVHIFEKNDPFLSGKIALSVAALLSHLPHKTKIFFCGYFREIISSCLNQPTQSWGIYFFLSALNKFKELGVLEELFSYKQLNELRAKLNWSDFVSADSYELIDKPRNFYQVAYAISLFRFHLGWEDGTAKEIFLEKILDHIESSSGPVGFSDETEGKGLFDRYSVLLIAEIAHRFRESGLPITNQMKTWLKQAADFVLMHANNNGTGFQYGRSIGPYGDSSTNEVLSAAAWFGVLDNQDKNLAFTYCQLSTERFLDFWWDHEKNRVNLWSDGRLTDKYRGSFRAFGETLSLLHQHIYTTDLWREIGMKETETLPSQDEKSWLSSLPPAKYYGLNNHISEYGIFIFRRGGNAFTLPLINADKYHNKSFYLPIPYNNLCIQGIPDEYCDLLVPQLSTQDGRQLMPLSWFKKVEHQNRGDIHLIKYKQYKFDVTNESRPVSDKKFRGETIYSFSNEYLSRKDTISWEEAQVTTISTRFLSFYPVASVKGKDVFFQDGPIEKITFKGFDQLSANSIQHDKMQCSNESKYVALIVAKTPLTTEKKITIEWIISLRD